MESDRKGVDFDNAYPNYVKWKKEQKGPSLAIATQNCVDDYIVDGMSKEKGTIAVRTQPMAFFLFFLMN